MSKVSLTHSGFSVEHDKEIIRKNLNNYKALFAGDQMTTRKKEIEVWVDKDILYHRPNYVNYNVNTGGHKIINSLKATLIIELPERKVEITESELRDCFDTFRRLDDDHDRRLVYSFYEFAKQKLFGNQGEG